MEASHPKVDKSGVFIFNGSFFLFVFLSTSVNTQIEGQICASMYTRTHTQIEKEILIFI